jgi:hypothetical protein
MRSLLGWVLGWFRRRRAEQELFDEIAAHLDFVIADHVAAGMSPEEARRAAALKFGGTLQTKEAFRDRQGWPVLEHLLQDLRYAVRVLAKRPILLVTTTISIGLGVGTRISCRSARGLTVSASSTKRGIRRRTEETVSGGNRPERGYRANSPDERPAGGWDITDVISSLRRHWQNACADRC